MTTPADIAAAVAAGRITPGDAAAWMVLARGPGRTQVEAGQLLGVSQPEVSRKARRLESAGLLTIVRHGRWASEYRA